MTRCRWVPSDDFSHGEKITYRVLEASTNRNYHGGGGGAAEVGVYKGRQAMTIGGGAYLASLASGSPLAYGAKQSAGALASQSVSAHSQPFVRSGATKERGERAEEARSNPM